MIGFCAGSNRRPQRVVAFAQQCYSVVRIRAAREVLAEHLRAPVGGEGKVERAAVRVNVAELMSLVQDCGGASRGGW